MVDVLEATNLATALSLLIALAVGIGQLRQADRTRRHEMTLGVLAQVHNAEYNRALRLVLELPPGYEKDLQALSPEQREAIYHMYQQTENLGVGVQAGLLDMGTVRAAFGPGVLALWHRLEPYVRTRRERHPGIGRAFEALVRSLEAEAGAAGGR